MANKGKLIKPNALEIKTERPVRLKLYKYIFLIVCEDTVTEPSYFSAYKAQIPPNTIYLKSVGTGRGPKGVVERAVEERNLLQHETKKSVNKVWAVFDVDDASLNETTKNNFENAFSIAKTQGIEIAYSNEVFELWLLLHLCDIGCTSRPRHEIYEMLQTQIRKTKKYANYLYDHKRPKKETLDIVFELGNVDLAIKRAENLLEKQVDKEVIDANPSTRVHLLVKDLLEWINYYQYT